MDGHIANVSSSHFPKVDEYIADPGTFTVNRMIAEAYRDGVKRGSFIYPERTPHYLHGKADQVVYKIKAVEPADPSRPKANM